jgi:site-specific recombinase XerD
MLEKFFSRPVTLRRLRDGALGPHIDAFAELLSKGGYAKTTGKQKIRQVSHFGQWLKRRRVALDGLNEQTVARFLNERKKQKKYLRSLHGVRSTLSQLLDGLRQSGIIPRAVPEAEDNAIERVEREFERYLVQERGLSEETVLNRRCLVLRFLGERFGRRAVQLDHVAPSDVTRFVLRYAHTVSSARAKQMVGMLRAFFRFLYLRGDIAIDLAASVPSVAEWRFSEVVKFLEPEEVELVLKSCDRSQPMGLRDYAILLLLARLGLRAGEVVVMTLDDIDWDAGELTVRGKGGRQDRLPMPQEVGEALCTYLCHGRPRCATRRVFICMQAPHRGFARSITVSNIVRRALERAGLNPPCKGAHVLRHSLATGMLRGGASLAEIGEVLRHRLPSSTQIYTKVDLKVLRDLARPWPGGAP